MNPIIKKISEYLFNKWKNEKISEGYHIPELCPEYEKDSENEKVIESADLIHCHKCLTNLVEFENLDDYVKEEYIKKAGELFDDFKKAGLLISIK